MHREGGVDEDGAALGKEVECTHAGEATREGLVGALGIELAALGRLLEIVRGGGGEERPRGEGARAAAARPRGHDRKREGQEQGHRREQRKGCGQQRVLDGDGIVDVGRPEADERLGDAIDDAARPGQRLGAHVLRQGSRPDGTAQDGGGAVCADERRSRQAALERV